MNRPILLANPSQAPIYTSGLPGWPVRRESAEYTIGVLPGEGIGPEVIAATLEVLAAIRRHSGERFNVRTGGKIGLSAKREAGGALTPGVIAFCESVFADRGAILSGPGGGRYVYELRSRFDLFCKFTPLRPIRALADTGVVKAQALNGVDILMVRENTGGLYFGSWDTTQDPGGMVTASQHFGYRSDQVERILRVAVQVAQMRRGRLCLVVKFWGTPSISELWTDTFGKLAAGTTLATEILEVDNAAFQLINAARNFDVVVSPNMFGDVLADCGGLLLGARGMSCSGNFGGNGMAVYQTGHGAAHDLAGRDRANPLGQILSLAMLLQQSFGLASLAGAIESAIDKTLAEGWRTADIFVPGCKLVGTAEMGTRIAAAVENHLASASAQA